MLERKESSLHSLSEELKESIKGMPDRGLEERKM